MGGLTAVVRDDGFGVLLLGRRRCAREALFGPRLVSRHRSSFFRGLKGLRLWLIRSGLAAIVLSLMGIGHSRLYHNDVSFKLHFATFGRLRTVCPSREAVTYSRRPVLSRLNSESRRCIAEVDDR